MELLENANLDNLLAQIDFNAIPSEIYSYQNLLENKQKARLQREYRTIENYLAIVFYFIFVEKREKSEFAQLLGYKRAESAYYPFYNLGWSYSNDWNENMRLREDALNAGLQKREAAKKIRLEDNKELSELMNKAHRYKNKMTFKNFASEEEYLKVLIYYSCIKKLTRTELIPIMGDSYGTLYLRLKKFGINLTPEEGIERKKDNKTHDYIKGHIARTNTTRKSQIKNLTSGSANQLYARNFLADNITSYFPPERYDAVVGCSNTGILGKKEIDIPIIIYDLQNKNLFRIAFEYNGEYWHDSKKDEEKKILAKQRGWIYYCLMDNSEYSNDITKLNQKLHAVMKEWHQMLISLPLSITPILKE